jgi:Polysaccharide biosynthesis/export protein
MTISRWKIMACMLAFSLGGLAFVAGPMNNRSNAQWDDSPACSEKPRPEATLPAPPAPIAAKPQAREWSPETLPVQPAAAPFEPVAPVQTSDLVIPAVSQPTVANGVTGALPNPVLAAAQPAPWDTGRDDLQIPLPVSGNGGAIEIIVAAREELNVPETLPAPRVVGDATVFAADAGSLPATPVAPLVVVPLEVQQPTVITPQVDEPVQIAPSIPVVVAPASGPIAPPAETTSPAHQSQRSTAPISPYTQVEQPVAPAPLPQLVSEPVVAPPAVTKAPTCDVPVTYQVGADDVLAIRIKDVLPERTESTMRIGESRDYSNGYPILVQDDGTIALPLIETVHVCPPLGSPGKGKTLAEIEQLLRKAYTDKKILADDPQIAVKLYRKRKDPTPGLSAPPANQAVSGTGHACDNAQSVAGVSQASSSVASTATSTANASKLKMLLRLGDGKPRFEIRNTESTELLFKVYGEKVELQSAPEGMQTSPIAGVTAVGQVRFVGPGIEGTCDQLSVLSGTGEVLLKGNVHMKTKHGKAWNEVTGEKMIYQIGANGLSTTSNGSVVPASYNSR